MKKDNADYLINKWILKKLSSLQNDYFGLELNNWGISSIANKLTRFVQQTLSAEYLELIKATSNFEDKETRKVLLFVYQQSIAMIHPIMPYITDYLSQIFFQEKILNSKLELIEINDEKNELWQVDCCLSLINAIRKIRKKNNLISDFFLEFVPDQKIVEIDFNYFIYPLTSGRVFLLDKAETLKKMIFPLSVFLKDFGVLWYDNKEIFDLDEARKKLHFYEKELKRSLGLFENIGFIEKAPKLLIEKEKEKMIHYLEQKKKIEKKLKIKDTT